VAVGAVRHRTEALRLEKQALLCYDLPDRIHSSGATDKKSPSLAETPRRWPFSALGHLIGHAGV
jgi:hypothetical protein